MPDAPAKAKPTISGEWPPLPLDGWKDTYATLHMWTQMAGKVRMALAPAVNHWWHVTLYVSARGLTTSPVAAPGVVFEIEFDFVDHQLVIRTGDGRTKSLPLAARSVADFYGDFMAVLKSLGIRVKIWPMPQEVPDPIRFDEDRLHATYDPKAAGNLHQILLGVDAALQEFRGRFTGKCSPVHFFWGSFDLCVTRFSGRQAPTRAGADAVTREAYSQEVMSAGFWPGSGAFTAPAFYAYAAPEPKDLADAALRAPGAYYHRQLNEFIFPYEDMRRAANPRDALLEFLQSTYEAGASLAKWDRKSLER